jgi:hypothetical protein
MDPNAEEQEDDQVISRRAKYAGDGEEMLDR